MPIWLYSNFILLSRAFDQMNYRVINGIICIVDIYRTNIPTEPDKVMIKNKLIPALTGVK